ncbi:MAG: hypothetical protein HFJ13_07995 [Clostridium sp.]|jgi:hypothetical protein|uniref:hypothetical protein n=1 Tax=Clostridium sp. TaxID=1506 RepID=UPI0025C0F27A|nr:hypothetical protein [Clostridium sp.]MCI9069954.1 hypothetical protein [Clostridium sp.]MCI9304038.1 hypothetical protein [Clostridium sp.]
MRDIEWLKRQSEKYELVAEYLNNNTLKVYSPKYLFDSWLIVESEDAIELWHQSKSYKNRNLSYHLQKSLPKYNKIWALQRIKSHNRYAAFYRNNKINIVDKLLAGKTTKIKLS